MASAKKERLRLRAAGLTTTSRYDQRREVNRLRWQAALDRAAAERAHRDADPEGYAREQAEKWERGRQAVAVLSAVAGAFTPPF